MKGTVKFFNEKTNYGFIEPEDGSEDYFVHRSDVVEGPIAEGDVVEFDSEEGDQGLKAVNVSKVEEI